MRLLTWGLKKPGHIVGVTVDFVLAAPTLDKVEIAQLVDARVCVSLATSSGVRLHIENLISAPSSQAPEVCVFTTHLMQLSLNIIISVSPSLYNLAVPQSMQLGLCMPNACVPMEARSTILTMISTSF